MASHERTRDVRANDVVDDTERGASLVEYALLLALIAVVCIGALSFFGTSMSDDYDENTRSMFHDG